MEEPWGISQAIHRRSLRHNILVVFPPGKTTEWEDYSQRDENDNGWSPQLTEPPSKKAKEVILTKPLPKALVPDPISFTSYMIRRI